jgi:S1-C subfamily serine protease
MQALDYLIMLACISAAIGGFRLGFVARVSSWIGMVLGLLLALVILPHILRNASHLADSSRLSFVILLLLAGLLLGQMLGILAGSRIAAVLPPGPLRMLDKSVGAIAGVVGVLVVLWLTIPTAANVPGWSAEQVHSSQLAQAIANDTPRPPNISKTLRRLVGSSQFPSVFANLAPSFDTGPPPESVNLPQTVVDRVKASSVKVEGTACRRTQDGSGFVVANDIIATNAHVVAGERRTTIIDLNGDVLDAYVVLYDPARDIALLYVPHFDAAPLPIGQPQLNQTGAVFGHPGGQAELAITPAAIRRQVVAEGRDLYDTENTRRDVLILASELAQGDSGGALVNTNGQVIGVAFAIAPDKPGTSYALSTTVLQQALAEPHSSIVSTQNCVVD